MQIMSTHSSEGQGTYLLETLGVNLERRELAISFIAVFSRFEYALKAANYVDDKQQVRDADGNKRKLAKPDWGKFASELGEERIRKSEKDDPQFRKAVYYLTTYPPNTQVVGDPRWVKKKAATGHSRELLERVREVRNNLFHGGKEWPYPGTERDRNLLLGGIIVLSKCLELTPTVMGCFCEGLTEVEDLVEGVSRLPEIDDNIESG